MFQEYSGSTANILTAFFCAGLFPDKFNLTIYIMLSMMCLLLGIFLYESKKAEPKATAKAVAISRLDKVEQSAPKRQRQNNPIKNIEKFKFSNCQI